MSIRELLEEGKEGVITLYSNFPPSIRYFSSSYSKAHKLYKEAQWWTKDDICRWQLSRLKSVVSFAYDNTEGYRQLYDEAKVSSSDIHSLDDIRQLPFTTKELLRDNIELFTFKDGKGKGLHKTTTGGSTGIPFTFYADKKNSEAEYGFIHSAWESIGWKNTDWGIKLRGAHLGDVDHLMKKTSYHHYALSASFMTEVNYERYMQLIEQSKASYLHVYPSTLTDLAHLIITHKDEGRLKIKHIFLGSENLYEWQKDLIKKAFPDARLMSWYGHSERAIWAPWCEKEERYHLNPFYGYAEILNGELEVDEGEIGELVGTSFWMFGTPFIRYRTKDYAEKGASRCEKCGRNFQLLNYVDGRLSEIIVGKTGRRISLTVFAGSIMHGKAFEHIKQFRFIQHELGKIQLSIIPTSLYCEEDYECLKKSVETFLGEDFDFTINTVQELSKSKNGKYTYLEQHLSVDRTDNNRY